MAKKDKDQIEENIEDQESSPEVEQELSEVATNPKQSMLILVVIGAIFAYLVFNLFISADEEEKKEEPVPVPTEISKPVQISDNDIPAIPNLPTPPKLEDPTPPPPPPPLAEEQLPTTTEILPPLPTDATQSNLELNPQLPFSNPEQDEAAAKRKEAKRKSSIMLIAGTPTQKTPEQIQQEADFTKRGDMYLVLGRGKMIDAIVESAINTDFGGEIRAIVSRDVYSEWGKNILVPKGSRVFGTYSSGISGAYGRIDVIWNRIDLASGYSINLNGIGMDALGRKGAQGRVDNKFKERLGNVVLRSAFNVVLAQTIDRLVKPQIASQQAANQQAAASSIISSVNQILTGSDSIGTKASNICSSARSLAPDTSSALRIAIDNACQTTPENEAQLTTLANTITTAANAATQNVTQNTEETKAQEASKKAFEDIGEVVKTLVEEQEFKPTITIDQGTPIKIYVNKDYRFPKAAVKKSRLMK